MIIIKSLGLAGRAIRADGDGTGYVMSYNPEAHDGMGTVAFTSDKSKAIKFNNVSHALEFVRQVPRNRPLRGDGNPNRPITAFHLQFEQEGETPH